MVVSKLRNFNEAEVINTKYDHSCGFSVAPSKAL